MKEPFNPPRRFETSYGGFHINSVGTTYVGAVDKTDAKKRPPPKGETEDGVKKAFVGVSSQAINFVDFGTLPEPNKMAQKKF